MSLVVNLVSFLFLLNLRLILQFLDGVDFNLERAKYYQRFNRRNGQALRFYFCRFR